MTAVASDASKPGALPRPSILALVIGVIAVVVCAPALGGDFIYDDHALIQGNVHVHGFHDWKHWFSSDFWDVTEEVRRFGTRLVYWRPAVSASYALDWKVGGGAPVIFHLTNLLWSGVGGVLAFVALRRWIGALVPAFVAALLFVVHPTKTESVAWIAGRTDVMCLVAMLIAGEGMARRLRGARHGHALELVGTVLSYMTKEQALVLPAFAAVEAWAAAGRPAIDRGVVLRLVKAAVPQALVAVAYLAMRTMLLPIGHTSAALGVVTHAWLVLETMGRFFVLAFVPHDLSVQQALMHSSEGAWIFDFRYVALGALGTAALVAAAVVTRRKNPLVTVGIGFFFVTILPTSNVVNTGMLTMLSERFLYVPVLGLALAVSGVLVHAGRFARAATFATLGVSAVFAVVGARHASDFADEDAFWARELALHPDSLEALRFAQNRAAAKKQYRLARLWAMQAQQMAARWYAQTGFELDFTVAGTELTSRLIPDRERDSLLALEGFYATLRDPAAQVATLRLHDTAISMPLQGKAIAGRIEALRPKILVYEADLASRLGDDGVATSLATSALAECQDCGFIARAAAIIYARAGRYDLAFAAIDAVAAREGEESVKPIRAILTRARDAGAASASAAEGPLKLNLRALELSSLEAWGRAYAVLVPFEDEIKTVPDLAFGFSELACRAGEIDVAREVLSTIAPPAKVEPTLRAWSAEMGWSDSETE